jgi:MFS family permease
MTVTNPPRHRLVPPLLRKTEFQRYWTGQTISLFGDQISLLAIPLLAVLITGAGPKEMGYLTAALLVPNLFFSLLAGAWADRRADKRRIMIAADLGRAAALLAIPVLYWMDALTLNALYVVAFVIGTLSVLFEVCRNTLFVALVDKDEYVAANTLLNGSRALSFVAGPSAGGFLVQLFTAPIALVADALSFLASAVQLGRIRPVEPVPAAHANLGISQGLRFIAGHPVLRASLLASTTLNLFNYIFAALFILYATVNLGVSPGALGAVIGIASIGALLGAAVTGRLVKSMGIGPAYLLSYLLFPAPLILVPLASGSRTTVLILLFAAEFLSGAGVMVLDIVAGSIHTAVIPDEFRARVSGAHRTVNYGIRPIGAVLGGFLGAALSVPAAIWIGVLGATVSIAWLLFSPIPAMREL